MEEKFFGKVDEKKPAPEPKSNSTNSEAVITISTEAKNVTSLASVGNSTSDS